MFIENVEGAAAQVSRVAVKPPPFWKPDPRLWFLQVEAQFVRAGVTTDDTKYYTVVAEIDSSVLKCAADLISNPPDTDKYEALKARLIAEFSESEDGRFKRLFDNISMGDKKPSTLLREMKNLSDNRLDAGILKSLWLRQLPTHIQQILTTVEGELEKLGERADSIVGIHSQPKINMVGNDSADIDSALMELSRKFDRLERQTTEQREARGRRNSPRPRRTRSSSGELCWYHRTFKEKATKCRAPFSFRHSFSENL